MNTLTHTIGDGGVCIFFSRVSDPHFFFADPDPDPGGIRGRGLGVKGKNDFFFLVFFSRFR